ncbi:aminomethyl-transferring glycine dehydrogenase [Aestuariivirga litoralis]|uniref:aminomethyl-transferring glycine dehydrogenase n=1 Tax=Aestuariivirga litoralis TaxID=2650924 RepID=UPI001FF0497C|nr:aminomethyl-transferring glycine dehydrogenase [Aestuariivirga litoralis]
MTVPFSSRHIGPNETETASMLKLLGSSSLDDFIAKAVPEKLRSTRALEMEPALSEHEALAKMKAMAEQNKVLTSAIGMGYYGTHVPPVILRNVLENPGWYTAYTPYQAEVSQGRLEALLNYQQMVMDLTGLDIANASLLDEATAAAEAMAMAKRVAKSQANVFFIDKDTHPQTIGVLQTRAKGFGIELQIADVAQLDAAKVFGALLSYPGSSGAVRDISSITAKLHEAGALAIVATDLLALTLLKSPGEMGADIALGCAQRFGVPMGFGGPHAAFFAVKNELKRVMPGRLIGVSVDAAGHRALRMALQTREQHIRRDKATSNICTAQVLLAVMAGFYACWHGPEGLKSMAEGIHAHARKLAGAVKAAGHELLSENFFDTVTIKVKGGAKSVFAAAAKAGINLRLVDADHVGVALDETTTDETIRVLIKVFGGTDGGNAGGISLNLQRQSAFLTHPVFHRHRTETEMMRYMRLLQGKDLALDQAMIPLGSCTMKLNAAAEMIPVTWPEIGQIHPFAPPAQTKGYAAMFASLEKMLCEITGFDAVSLQPNAGSQGEYAGLMAIRGYLDKNGGKKRDVCLIPISAHGTNPASAAMCGMKIVVVACDAKGNVEVADLEAKAKQHAHDLAALMITYPSTHGVYEDSIVDICRIIHENGGQVYLDGANLNAQVGLMRPAELGADVCHMNLHKTFCIPHGGGGPGMGPIGVRAHLAPHLPGHAVIKQKSGAKGAVSAAPYGSASILPISWMYIAMMGGNGLTLATKMAVLNANYMAARLKNSFPILYTGPAGTVAHECILDLRWLKEKGLSVEDVAKRLADYGFHAPTMSFPVVDTLMVEPTESEAKGELDRFCDAMIAIRKEIDDVIAGRADKTDNVLKNAPHTHKDLLGEWKHPYQKAQAFFPLGDHGFKYWPPVKRVDNVYGDRNLICACPPMEDYLQAAE